MTARSNGNERLGADGWAFVGTIGVGQLIGLGILYGTFPAFLGAIEAVTGWSRVAIVGAITASQLVTAAAALPVGLMIERGAARRLMVGGALAGGALLAGLAYAPSLAAFYGLWILLGVAAACCLLEPAFAVLAAVLRQRFRMGATALTLLTGLASSTFLPIGYLLLQAFGLHTALIVLGLLFAVVPTLLYLAKLPARVRPAVKPQQAATSNLRDAFGTRRFWAIAVALSGMSFTWGALNFHLLPFLLESRVSESTMLVAVALIGPLQIGVRLVLIVFGPDWPASGIARVLVVSLFLTLFLMLTLMALPLALMPFALAYAAAGGLLMVVKATIVPELFSLDGYASISGALSVPVATSRAVAPMVAALIWQLSGGYAPVLWVLIAVMVVSTAALLLAGRGGPGGTLDSAASGR